MFWFFEVILKIGDYPFKLRHNDTLGRNSFKTNKCPQPVHALQLKQGRMWTYVSLSADSRQINRKIRRSKNIFLKLESAQRLPKHLITHTSLCNWFSDHTRPIRTNSLGFFQKTECRHVKSLLHCHKKALIKLIKFLNP